MYVKQEIEYRFIIENLKTFEYSNNESFEKKEENYFLNSSMNIYILREILKKYKLYV